MFTILWILVLAILVGFGINWLIDNNGEVIINWFGYQILMDSLTMFLISVFLVILIFIFSYFLARLLSFRFPNIFKVFFKKSYMERLETIIKRQNMAFDEIANLLEFLEISDLKAAKKSKKKLHNYTKNKRINDYLSDKISLAEGDSGFVKAIKKVKKFRFRDLFRRR